jgi:hypothetical protein
MALDNILNNYKQIIYSKKIQCNLELSKKAQVSIICPNNINILKVYIDDTEANLVTSSDILDDNYNSYITIESFEVGEHKIEIISEPNGNSKGYDINLSENEEILNLMEVPVADVVYSTIECKINVL